MYLILGVVILGEILDVIGHGMVLNPVHRGARWRVDKRAPVNYDDSQLYCGGFSVCVYFKYLCG